MKKERLSFSQPRSAISRAVLEENRRAAEAMGERLTAKPPMTLIEMVGTTVGGRAGFVMADESAALSASPLACAVADAWLRWCKVVSPFNLDLWGYLRALELATRGSPLRKVKP